MSKGKAIEHLVESGVRNQTAVIDHPRLCWGGSETFIYVKDAARALILACRVPALEQRVMNVTMCDRHTFADVIALVRDCLDRGLTVEYAPGYQSEATADLPGTVYDTTLARQQLGFEPAFDMRTALLDYAAFVRTQDARKNPPVLPQN